MNSMKQILVVFLAVLALTVVSCKTGVPDQDSNQISTDVINNPVTANGTGDDSALPKFKFEHENYDFGVVVQGEKVSYVYKFTNEGGADLIVTNVKASCGCTVPRWDKEPIKPGGTGEIEMVFDSSGKKGVQHKTMTVLANTQPNTIKLGFTAEVVVPGN